MKRTEDFFIPDNEVRLPEEVDYSRADEYISSAEAFSRLTYQSVYIIDYLRRNFLYVSPNALFLAGLTPEEMKKLNYKFYLSHVPEDEHEMLLEINRAGFAFYNTLPLQDRKNWYIQYDFHIFNHGRPILVHHKLTPIALTSDGRVWLALCVVSTPNHTTAGHVEMHCAGSSEYLEYNFLTRRWDKRSTPELTKGEMSVITLSAQGYTMSEIAGQMCLSIDSIKKYRRQIFEKFHVRNISEAIVAATNNKLW